MHEIRLASPGDAVGILDIYRPIVVDTAISFELEPPALVDIEERIGRTLDVAPWLVTETRGRIDGYAYAGPHRSRGAYRWSVETSVFVHRDARGGGVGTRLYEALLRLLALQGFRRAFAGITLPNAASVALHERSGFVPIGVFGAVGFKHGSWHDVGWWQTDLGSTDPADNLVEPGAPILLSDLEEVVAGAPGMAAAALGTLLEEARAEGRDR